MTDSKQTNSDSENKVGPTPIETRFLTPQTCKIHLGTHGALHVTIPNERIYGGVYAAYAFPVAHPAGYVSLIHNIGDGNEFEIGIIRDLSEFPPADAELVRQALARRYFVHVMNKIDCIGWSYGFVSLDVQTDKGPMNFLVRWKQDRAVDYGKSGKVLIDVNDNRFLIPDLRALPPKERMEFQRYIYW